MRIVDMRGVNLDVFDFDYDLEWAGFLMNADVEIYGRYGGRDAQSADGRLSLVGLRYAMEKALETHRRPRAKRQARLEARRNTVKELEGFGRLRQNSCVHCHQVYELRREQTPLNDDLNQSELWVYPLPENVGLEMDVDQGNRVKRVQPESAAFRAGLRAGDIIERVNGQAIASIADLQYAFHRVPATGPLHITWSRKAQDYSGVLEVKEGWKRTDLSWRASIRKIGPTPPVQGEDLDEPEKKALGLAKDQLALRLGPFPSRAVQQAGLRAGDVIVGVDGRRLEMTARQFAVYLRLNFRAGQQVTFDALRDGNGMQVSMMLAGPGSK